MKKYNGDKLDKVIYDGILDVNQTDIIANEMNMKLLGVYQSVDSSKFYRRFIEDPESKKMKLV